MSDNVPEAPKPSNSNTNNTSKKHHASKPDGVHASNGGRSSTGPKQNAGRKANGAPRVSSSKPSGVTKSDSAKPNDTTIYKAGPASKASPARRAALEVGSIVRLRNAFAQETIAKRIDTASLTSEDRAFATRLALGVASSSGTLDEVIDRCLRKPDDIQADVRDALRVSTYEIIFLNKSPHAAVDQGVELVKCVAPNAGGLANAVLRKIVTAKNTFPFGDPSKDIAALARINAFPLWLAKRLVADLGYGDALNFMVASNEPAPLFIAVNRLRANYDEICSLFFKLGAGPSSVVAGSRQVPGCIRVSDTRVIQDEAVKELFRQGKILVSDAASQMVAAGILGDKAPETFLEIGSGRATKTILLQSNAARFSGKQMSLYALDNFEFKMKILTQRASLYGVDIAGTFMGDAAKLDEIVGSQEFEGVFIDAPCSGLGTLRRHPEIRWRLKSKDIDDLAELGLSMLKSAAAHVRIGGTLSYATCTVTHTENTMVVKRFLESEEGSAFALAPIFEKGHFSTKLMPRSYDAHFAVRMVRVK